MKETVIGTLFIAVGFAAIIFVLGGSWYAFKTVQVWGASMTGQAILAEAEYSKQARVKEAQAKADSAALEGQAELTRAEFAARANEALAKGLGGSEAYLRYLYIRMLEEQGNAGQVIYIPTEAGVPILEAGKRH